MDLERALHELFEEGALRLPVGDLEEHPNAWLQYGYANSEKWSVVTVDVYRNGVAILTKYDVQDDDEPIFEYHMSPVSQAICLGVWQDLAASGKNRANETFVTLPINLPRTGSISLPPIPHNPSNPTSIDVPSIRGLEA